MRIQPTPDICHSPPPDDPVTPPPPVSPALDCLNCNPETTPYHIDLNLYGFTGSSAWLNAPYTLTQDPSLPCVWNAIVAGSGGTVQLALTRGSTYNRLQIKVGAAFGLHQTAGILPYPYPCVTAMIGELYSPYMTTLPGGWTGRAQITGASRF